MKALVRYWMEDTLERPFYEAEMTRTELPDTRGMGLLITVPASVLIICLSLLLT